MQEIMSSMGMGDRAEADENIEANTAVVYKPEYCWNYEAGTHLEFFDKTLMLDASLFYIDTRNQQISRYAESGLGRQMVNAGRSQSYGTEISARASLLDYRLGIAVNYGYTHATFKKYNDGEMDYSGNKVPFVPQNTLGASVEYRLPLLTNTLHALTFGLNTNAAGPIYWTESNDQKQNFYTTLGAHILAEFTYFSLDIWGKNLTNTRYDTFYFESMQRGFAQLSNPWASMLFSSK